MCGDNSTWASWWWLQEPLLIAPRTPRCWLLGWSSRRFPKEGACKISYWMQEQWKTCIQHSGSLTIKSLQARVKNINRIDGLSIQYQDPFQVYEWMSNQSTVKSYGIISIQCHLLLEARPIWPHRMWLKALPQLCNHRPHLQMPLPTEATKMSA